MLGALREQCARIRALFRTSDLDRDFEEELQSHVAMLTEDNLRRGLTPEEARRAALIRVGGAASLHERHREARGLPAFDSLLNDLRFALRLLIKDRWFTLYAADQAIDVSNLVTARLSLPPGQYGISQE